MDSDWFKLLDSLDVYFLMGSLAAEPLVPPKKETGTGRDRVLSTYYV